MPEILALRQEDQDFQVILRYLETSRTALATWDLISNKHKSNEQQKGNILKKDTLRRKVIEATGEDGHRAQGRPEQQPLSLTHTARVWSWRACTLTKVSVLGSGWQGLFRKGNALSNESSSKPWNKDPDLVVYSILGHESSHSSNHGSA